ncbi:MAG: GatB/YqeY domain-containing protein [Akkermansiaceae bacterium]
MSQLAEQITSDIKTAMRAKDTVSLTALRALKTALTNAAIEKGGLGTELEDSEAMAAVRKQIKQRQDSIEQFEKASRPELAEKEKSEIEVLSKYLPAALSNEDIEKIANQAIEETGAASRADMGKAMKRAQELAEGRADGKVLSSAIMKRLS